MVAEGFRLPPELVVPLLADETRRLGLFSVTVTDDDLEGRVAGIFGLGDHWPATRGDRRERIPTITVRGVLTSRDGRPG